MTDESLPDDHQKKSRITILRIIVGLLILINIILLSLSIARYIYTFEEGKFDAALEVIDQKNEEIRTLQRTVEEAGFLSAMLLEKALNQDEQINQLNSKIDSLQSERETLESETETLRSEISALNNKIDSLQTKLKEVKIVRVDVYNENCINQYQFVDGRLAAGTRAGGYTFFYIPPGYHDMQSCSEPYRSRCGDEKTYYFNSAVVSWTITRHPSCR